jgi:ClpA/ClpB-like protein
MTPAPNLQELIDTVRADAPGADALGELAQAARTAADLSQTGDQLMDHFVDQARRAGHSWSEISGVLGVSKQAAHKRYTGTAVLGSVAPGAERFTLRARAVLSATSAQTRALGDDAVRPEHFLLCLFEPAESLSAVALADAGIARDACAQQLGITPVDNPPKAQGNVPMSPEAIQVLRGSVEEALLLGHNYIGTEHFLLALFRDPESAAARALTTLGADHDRIAAWLNEKLAGYTQN